jgi:hypothetical protein
VTGISVLGSEIGRGHPFYTDGLVRALREEDPRLLTRRSDVFAVSRGMSRAAWNSVRASYRLAGKGGPVAALYHRVRGNVDYDRDSGLLRILGADLRRWAGDDGIVVVDHPAVVGALGGRPDVWYFHGELVAPPEAIVRKAVRIFVPREEVAGEFVRGGCHPEQVLVTGICVDPDLVAGAFERAAARRERIAGDGPLALAFFSSGAEPQAHVRALAAGAAAVAASRHRAIVFARRGGALEAAVREAGGEALAGGPALPGAAARGIAPEIVLFDSREDLDRRTAERFAGIDAVVSPPHERSNWAIALGVPFFLVGPDIGPFAPRNRSLLLRSGVAAEIRDEGHAWGLPVLLDELRAKRLLLRMAEMGSARPVDGFRRAARMLRDEARRRGWAPGS